MEKLILSRDKNVVLKRYKTTKYMFNVNLEISTDCKTL